MYIMENNGSTITNRQQTIQFDTKAQNSILCQMFQETKLKQIKHKAISQELDDEQEYENERQDN